MTIAGGCVIENVLRSIITEIIRNPAAKTWLRQIGFGEITPTEPANTTGRMAASAALATAACWNIGRKSGMTKNKPQISIRLKPETLSAVDKAAEKENRNRSNMIEMLLLRALNDSREGA